MSRAVYIPLLYLWRNEIVCVWGCVLQREDTQEQRNDESEEINIYIYIEREGAMKFKETTWKSFICVR